MARRPRWGALVVWAGLGLLVAVLELVGDSLDGDGSSLDSAALMSGPVLLTLLVSRASTSLDHPIRRQIYEHLLRLPGDHFRSIARSLRIGHGTACHHLAVLVDAGWLDLEKRNGRARYYPKGLDPGADRNDLYMRHWVYRDLRVRVLFLVVVMNNAGPTAVARQLGVSRQLAAYHLNRLVESGLLERGEGHYWPARSLH